MFMTVYAACFACKRLFVSNPHMVPSYQGQPICRTCIEFVNTKRREEGRPEWPVAANAYEPAEE